MNASFSLTCSSRPLADTSDNLYTTYSFKKAEDERLKREIEIHQDGSRE
jgi:hypothetical protein